MKIVVPVENRKGLESRVCEHFGSTPFYAICDTDSGSVSIVENFNRNHEHGQCTPTDMFSGNGVAAALCNGIGGRAQQKLQLQGIEVFMAGLAPTLGEALERHAKGMTRKVDPAGGCAGGHDCH